MAANPNANNGNGDNGNGDNGNGDNGDDKIFGKSIKQILIIAIAIFIGYQLLVKNSI